MRWPLALIVFLFSLHSFAEETVYLPLKAIPKHLKVDRLIQLDQFRVVALLANSLYEVGPKLQIDGKLAKSSAWDKERKKLTITLADASFPNSQELSADDVIKSVSACIKSSEKNTTSAFTKIVGYEEFVSGKTAILKGIKKVDKKRLIIETTGFAPLIKENLASISCSIVRSIQGHSNDLLDGAVSTGPYILVKKSDRQIELKKRSGSGPEKVIFEATDHFGDFQKLKDKMSLIVVNSDPGETPGFTKHANSMLGNWQLSFNNEKGRFTNLNLRKAVTYGLDFKHLREELNWTEDRLQKGLFPFGMRGFIGRALDEKKRAEASTILTSLGYSKKNPLKFTILMAKRHGANKVESAWIKAFGDLPIVAQIELVDQSKLVNRRDAGKFEVLYHGKAAGSHDPHIILASYLSSSRFNTPRVKNKLCDSKIRRALGEHDHDLRWAYYKDAEKCLLDTYFIVPLATVNSGYALVKSPWKLTRKNQYLLHPYYVDEWVKE